MAVAVRRASALPTLITVVAGVGISAQAYINGRLGESIGSGEAAAAINNGVGLVSLLVVTVAAGAIPRALRSLSQVRFWHLLGGLGGAMFIVAGAIGAPEIGVALLSVALVCGQTTGSLVADGAGLSPAGHQGVTTGRVAGVALTIAAVIASALGASAHLHVGLLFFALAAGAASALQQAANGHLARNTGEPLFAGTVNFAGGLPGAARGGRHRDRPCRRRTGGRRRRWSTRPGSSARRSPPRWRCSSRAWASCG